MAKARLPANWLRSARDALLPAASATVVEERHGSESWWGGEIRQRQSSQQQADSCSALTGTRQSNTRKGMFAELADAGSPAEVAGRPVRRQRLIPAMPAALGGVSGPCGES